MEYDKLLISMMETKGWTQKELAEKLGIHKALITNFVTGKRIPPVKTRHKIQQLLLNDDKLRILSSPDVGVVAAELKEKEAVILGEIKKYDEKDLEIARLNGENAALRTMLENVKRINISSERAPKSHPHTPSPLKHTQD